jgi:hypothetical protein
MKSFLEIPAKPLNEGTQREIFYPNGYGASIIQSPYSYGGKKGLYELAVLKGTEDNSSICYDTKVIDGVLGYLEEVEVDEILLKIQSLTDSDTLSNSVKDHLEAMTDESKMFLYNLLENMRVKE